jgi:CheY-like chemotaxis protein/HPt (histidine-containing phosphotransfer) domain-containing protein
MLLGDEARLRQILLNLLNNAVKFTREGHIDVRIQCKGRSDGGEVIRVSVADTGIGIAPDKRDSLFKRFSQVDRSVRREFGGTGLGLAISKRLVELMGGEIGVESELGSGSTFWIEVALPRASDVLPVPSAPADLPKSAPARILLAEDIEINQELARMLLEEAGHEVDIVWNGSEAIAAVQAKSYDLVMMDIQMPGVDGITATRRIRALASTAARIPILAMTANVLPQQVRQFKDAGMDDYIGKPMRREEVLRKLAKWLPETGPGNADPADAPGPSAPPSHSFDEKSFADFKERMGAEWVGQWLGRLDEHLQAFCGEVPPAEDRQHIARQAHALISQAALLGFSALAEQCVALEEACKSGRDIAALMEEVRALAENASAAVKRLRADALG